MPWLLLVSSAQHRLPPSRGDVCERRYLWSPRVRGYPIPQQIRLRQQFHPDVSIPKKEMEFGEPTMGHPHFTLSSLSSGPNVGRGPGTPRSLILLLPAG